jgi:hypothetical protein
MQRRFQVDLDFSEVKNAKYNSYVLGLIECTHKYDKRDVITGGSNFKCWEIRPYYSGVRIITPFMEVETDYDVLGNILEDFERVLLPYTEFSDRMISFNLETFDLEPQQMISLIKMYYSSLPIFFKMTKYLWPPEQCNFDFTNFSPEVISVRETKLFPLFEEYSPVSFYKYAATGMVTFTVARSSFKKDQILNWLRLFNCMIGQCKQLTENWKIESISTGKELVQKLEISANLQDWIIKQCAE